MARGNDDEAGTSRSQPHIHPLVPAVIAVVAVGVMVLVVAGTIGDDDLPSALPTTTTTVATTTTAAPTTTTTTTTLPDPVAAETLLRPGLEVDEPTTYRIVYEVVENSLAREETWVVRRPYESVVTSTRDGELISGTATSRSALRTLLSDRGQWLVIQPELHRAAFDQRPSASVGFLETIGVVELLGTDEYLGRPCQLLETGPPPGGGTLTAASEEERTEVCIDEAGIVLHERWELDGSPVVVRTATELELGVTPASGAFDPEPEIDDQEEIAAAFKIIAVPADAETLERLRTDLDPPAGYALDGAVFRAGSSGSRVASSEVLRFYSSGADLIEVAEVFADGSTDLSDPNARRIAVEGWDEVWLQADFRSASVRGRLSASTYVEVRHHDPAVAYEVFTALVRTDR